MSGDPEQEHFADGMVEDIITALSRLAIARNSSFTYCCGSAWRRPLAWTFRSPPDSGMMRGTMLCIKAGQTITRDEARSCGPPKQTFQKVGQLTS
jgi:hypothetical protein